MSEVAGENKTHYRKAFNSPYLSSADITKPTVLTIAKVILSNDASKKTKDVFNTAHFVEKEIRPGQQLKPMILNAHNSKVMYSLTGSHWIEDWANVPVTIYVDANVRFGRDTVEGLRISPQAPQTQKPLLTKDNKTPWENAKKAYIRDGNFAKVLERYDISEASMEELMNECR